MFSHQLPMLDGQPHLNLGSGGARTHWNLEFIVALRGELVRINALVRTPTGGTRSSQARTLAGARLVNADDGALWHMLDSFLGPSLSQQDLCHTLFMIVNISTQLSGGKPFCRKLPDGSLSTAFLRGLCNVARSMAHLTA